MVRLVPALHKFVLNGVDITSYVYSFDLTKMKNQAISTAKIVLNSKIENIMTITDAVISNSLTVQRGFATSTERYIFRGEVTTYSYKGSIYELNCMDKLYAASRREFDYTFDINTDPEAGIGSEIFKRLCDECGLSYSASSIVSTGTASFFTITNYPCKGKIISTMQDLAKNYIYQIFYNSEDDLVYFIPEGNIPTSTILTTGTEIVGRIRWNNTAEDTANNVTVIGGEQLDWATESFAGPVTEVTLIAKPIDTDVYVGGVKVQRGINSSDPKDFYVLTDQKKIIFTVASSTIVINYSYNIPVKVGTSNDASIATYGQIDKTVVNDKLTNTDDAELYVSKYLDTNSDILTTAPINVTSNNDLTIGQTITIVDGINDVVKNPIVTSIKYSYPYKYDEIQVGRAPLTADDIKITMLYNIYQLKRQLATNSDISVQLINSNANIEVVGYTEISHADPDADVLYWDSDVQGTWDDFDWGDDVEETYTEIEKIYINGVVVV